MTVTYESYQVFFFMFYRVVPSFVLYLTGVFTEFFFLPGLTERDVGSLAGRVWFFSRHLNGVNWGLSADRTILEGATPLATPNGGDVTPGVASFSSSSSFFLSSSLYFSRLEPAISVRRASAVLVYIDRRLGFYEISAQKNKQKKNKQRNHRWNCVTLRPT